MSVDEFASGASVGGVQQLIGNVWEWTSEFVRDQRFAARRLCPRRFDEVRGAAERSIPIWTEVQSHLSIFGSGQRTLAQTQRRLSHGHRLVRIRVPCDIGWRQLDEPA